MDGNLFVFTNQVAQAIQRFLTDNECLDAHDQSLLAMIPPTVLFWKEEPPIVRPCPLPARRTVPTLAIVLDAHGLIRRVVYDVTALAASAQSYGRFFEAIGARSELSPVRRVAETELALRRFAADQETLVDNMRKLHNAAAAFAATLTGKPADLLAEPRLKPWPFCPTMMNGRCDVEDLFRGAAWNMAARETSARSCHQDVLQALQGLFAHPPIPPAPTDLFWNPPPPPPVPPSQRLNPWKEHRQRIVNIQQQLGRPIPSGVIIVDRDANANARAEYVHHPAML